MERGSNNGEQARHRRLGVYLLYDGGIGTFGKGWDEANLEVGDRANDRVRVDGNDLHARVVGEARDFSLYSILRPEWEKERRGRRTTG
jgi:glutamate dehydrogenase